MDELASKVDLSGWTLDDKNNLLSSILDMEGDKAKKSYKTVETSIKWENIKLDGKTPEECKAMYHRLISKVRKYRTMSEIVSDAVTLMAKEPSQAQANEFADLPKKPPTAFSLFVMKRIKRIPDVKGVNKMKALANDWNELSDEKKEAYKKKYIKLKKKYEENLDTFRHNHPGCAVPGASPPHPPLPSKLFVESRLEKIKRKNPELSNSEAVKKLTNKYKQLSDSRKLKWIKRAKDSLQVYQEQFQQYLSNNPKSTVKPSVLHLSKEEQRIWDSSKGKPLPVPAKNLFMYFCNTRRDNFLHLTISEQSTELSAIYHKLTEDEIKDLADKFKQEVEEYIHSYNEYYTALSEVEKSHEKSPEVALGAYYKILKNNKMLMHKKKNKKKKAKENLENLNVTESNKVKLSDLLPRPRNNDDNGDHEADDDHDDDNISNDDSDDSAASSEVVTSSKRKIPLQQEEVAPHKKMKNDPSAVSPNKQSKNQPTDNEDALLSLWSPLKQPITQSHDEISTNQNVDKVKTHKKSKV